MADGLVNFRIEDIVDDAHWRASQPYIPDPTMCQVRAETIDLLQKSGVVVGKHLLSGAAVPHVTMKPGEAKRLLDNLDELRVPYTEVIQKFYYEIAKGLNDRKLYLFVEG